MKHKILINIFVTLLLVSALGSVWAATISSSTMEFQGTLTENGGEYSGTIMLQTPGFDNYAMIGSTVQSNASSIDGDLVGNDHDAYPNWDPDVPDDTWYALNLDGITDTWDLRYLNTENDPTSGAAYTPLSGTVHWTENYVSETNQNWSENWPWGDEDVKYAFPGFDLEITDNGSGNYTVTLTPAVAPTATGIDPIGPVVNENTGESYGTIQAAIDAATAGDVIEVAAGTYDEQLAIDKSLTITGSGADQTFVKATGNSPVITISSDNVTIQQLEITDDTQLIEGITIVSGASTGLTLSNIDFTNLGNNPGPGNAYGITIDNSFSNLDAEYCTFDATNLGEYSRATGMFAGKNNDYNLTDFSFDNCTFSKLFVGIYVSANTDGFDITNNTFGPFELEDCHAAVAGVYMGDGKDTYDLKNINVTGNTFTTFGRGVYIWNYAPNSTTGPFNISNNTFTNSIWSSPIRFIFGLDGMADYSIDGISIDNNTFTQDSDIGANVALIDLRNYDATITSCDIDITDNDMTFTGAPYTDAMYGIKFLVGGDAFYNTLIDNNVLNGGSTAGAGTIVSSGIVVDHYNGDYTWTHDLDIDATNNNITEFDNGLSVYSSTNSAFGDLPTNSSLVLNNNSLTDFDNLAIEYGSGEYIDATYNYWGPNDPADLIAGNVLYIPWYADEAMTTTVGNPVTNTTQNTGYATIQAAIDAANAGDVVSVSAGTFNEDNLLIDKALTLIGAGKNSTFIDASASTNTGNVINIDLTSGDVVISGFKIQSGIEMFGISASSSDNTSIIEISDNDLMGYGTGVTTNTDYAIIAGYGSVAKVVIDNNDISNCYCNGILFEKQLGETEICNNTLTSGPEGMPVIFSMSYGDATTQNNITTKQWIHDNTIDANGGSGIVFASAFGAAGYNERNYGKYTNIEIEDNVISNIGSSLKKGIQLEMDGDNGGFENTIISNNVISAPTPGTSRGIRLLGLVTSSVIENNNISGMNQGIYLSGTWGQSIYPTGSEIHYNLFSGNNMAVESQDTDISNAVDATRNYWGDPSGPDHTDNPLAGLGDPVSDNVDFMPWYATATTTPATELATLNSDDGSDATFTVFTSDELTNALANAVDGDEIVLGTGTFTGNFTVEDDITISAADGAVPTIQGEDGSPALTIDTDGVSVSGVNIEADSGDEAVEVSSNVTDGATVSLTDGSIISDIANSGLVNNASSGTVDATSNYWGDPDPSGYVTGSVDYGDPIVNDPVQISVSPATYLISGGETAQYDVNIGEVAEIRSFQIEIMMDKTDFDAPVEGAFTIGSLLTDAATAASTSTVFEVDDLTGAEDDYYTYRVTGTTLGVASGTVASGSSGQLFYLNLTSSTGVTNLDGSNISLGFLSARDETNGGIPCDGLTNGVVTIDSVVPVIDDITESENGYYATAPEISALGYSDNYNVATFYYQMDVTTGSWTEISGTASGTVPGTTWATADWTVPGFEGLGEGSHTIYFQAIDEAGNSGINYSWQFNKDTTAPDALAWKTSGNNNYPQTSVDSNNSIVLQWDDPSESYSYIHIWRKAYSDFGTNTGYPEYTGTAPSGTVDLPTDPEAATDPDYGWTKLTKANITSYTDTGMDRDYYYYAIYIEGLNGMPSAASTVSPALSYWLGDVNATPDGVVTSDDISLFSAAWNTTPSGSILDVGPTADNSRNALPEPDGAIDFEDLMIFAMNYENTNYTAYRSEHIYDPVPIRIDLELEYLNDEIVAKLILNQNNGFVKGVSIPIQFGSDLSFVSAQAGDIWPDGVFFDHIIKDNVVEISGSVLGGSSCIEGNGILAEVHFQITGSEDELQLQHMTARDIFNSDLEIMNNPTGNDPNNIIPLVNSLGNNYPNPFNPTTTINFGLKEDCKVNITLYNIRGQKVKTLINDNMPAGQHQVIWNGKDDSGKTAASGVYFYKMQTDDFSKIRKAMLLK